MKSRKVIPQEELQHARQLVIEKKLARRTSDMIRTHRRRAIEVGQVIDYELDDLRIAIRECLGGTCPYCERVLDVKTFSVDHRVPTSRGGRHRGDNLLVCCQRCNQRKGELTEMEFRALLATLDELGQFARDNVLRRLRGGFFRRGGAK